MSKLRQELVRKLVNLAESLSRRPAVSQEAVTSALKMPSDDDLATEAILLLYTGNLAALLLKYRENAQFCTNFCHGVLNYNMTHEQYFWPELASAAIPVLLLAIESHIASQPKLRCYFPG